MFPRIAFLVLCAAALAGCGPRPVAGGSKGVLRAGGEPLSDIQVTIHQAEGGLWRAVGFGVTASDGSFELVTNAAAASLWLPPGEYRCTLESVGAPVQIPMEYTTAETTPLAVTCNKSEQHFDLITPPLLRIQ